MVTGNKGVILLCIVLQPVTLQLLLNSYHAVLLQYAVKILSVHVRLWLYLFRSLITFYDPLHIFVYCLLTALKTH